MDKRKLTTNQGSPIGDNQNSITAGERGPALLEDYQLIEKLAHFDRERVPERVVHARGAGAHGVFITKNSMKKYTRAALFQEAGKETPVFARFSTVVHGQHSPETLRDPRGFAVKFYTEEGNWDFVGNNLPVFFIRDAMKFPDMVHSLKPNPQTNIQEPERYWDFMSLTPESTNMLVHLYTDEGIPANYRQMRGSSVHAYKWVNAAGNTVYVKLSWRPKQGIENLSSEKAAEIQGKDFNHASRDLYESVEKGEFPEWDLYVQVLDPMDMDAFDFDPLDATKDWSEDVLPSHFVGTMILNENPENIFAETESVGFNPGVLVNGMLPSEDKLLQGRLFSYSDTQRYRIGANYMQLPINCPFAQVENNQRDGHMPFKQQTGSVNYEPNSFDDTPKEVAGYTEIHQPMTGERGRQKIRKTDDFGQAGRIYRSYPDEVREQVVKNISSELSQINERIALRAVCNFFRADVELGKKLAERIGVDLTPYLQHME